MSILTDNPMNTALRARDQRMAPIDAAKDQAEIARFNYMTANPGGPPRAITAETYGGYADRWEMQNAQRQKDALAQKEAEARMRRQDQMMGIMGGMFGKDGGAGGAVRAPTYQPVRIPSLGGGSGGGIAGGGIFSSMANLTNGLAAAGNSVAQNRLAQAGFSDGLRAQQAAQRQRSSAIDDISRLSGWAGL